jgi:TRAP-type uncharacterized transport system substrate-binding protein
LQQRSPARAGPAVIRSRLVLEVASEIIGERGLPQQARISLRHQGADHPWELALFGSDAPSVFDEVARGEVQLAIVNPAAVLALAHRGAGPFTTPLPVRTITVIPSQDQFLCAIAERTGIRSLAEIRERRYPLKVSLRSRSDHAIYYYVAEVLGALGFSLEDIVSWGGEIHHHASIPSETPHLVERGEIDAIFDEAVSNWAPLAHQVGMRFMSLEEPLLQRLEGMGFRRARISRDTYPELPDTVDIATLDFSGWPVFTRADVPDELVRLICAALETRKDRIPWQGEGPLPLERMCRDGADTPLTVPLHPAAEQFWREQGYLA